MGTIFVVLRKNSFTVYRNTAHSFLLTRLDSAAF